MKICCWHDLRMSALKLSWQSALKGYYTILWQKYKNRFFRFFPCENGFGSIEGYAHAKFNLKKSIKGILYDFEKKNEKFYFLIFWWKSVVGVI